MTRCNSEIPACLRRIQSSLPHGFQIAALVGYWPESPSLWSDEAGHWSSQGDSKRWGELLAFWGLSDKGPSEIHLWGVLPEAEGSSLSCIQVSCGFCREPSMVNKSWRRSPWWGSPGIYGSVHSCGACSEAETKHILSSSWIVVGSTKKRGFPAQ